MREELSPDVLIRRAKEIAHRVPVETNSILWEAFVDYCWSLGLGNIELTRMARFELQNEAADQEEQALWNELVGSWD